jgi:hypothetical protein
MRKVKRESGLELRVWGLVFAMVIKFVRGLMLEVMVAGDYRLF